MKLLNYTGKVILAVVVIAGLGACSKKKNGSVAATPASLCTMNAYGQYVNAAGAQCSPTANQCTWNGSAYITPTGQACSPQSTCVQNAQGQYVNQMGQACTPYPQVPNYPHQHQQQQYGCNQWTYQYGIQYVPVYLQGGLQCVRIDLLQNNPQVHYPPNYYQSGYWEYGYDYYYAYPPYSGSGCSTQIDFGGSWGSVGICF